MYGTTDDPAGKPKSFVNDWLVNGQIAGGSSNMSRAKTAEKHADQVIQKYRKQNLVVTGHSQGGGISYHIATKYDLEGHHHNPAINHSNVAQAGKFANNKNAQSIYKTHLDFASPLAYSKNLKKSNTTAHTIWTIKGMDSPVSMHSIDHFSPTPYMVHTDGTVSVKRQTAKQTIKNGIKHTFAYHPVGNAAVSVTDRLPSLAHGIIDAGGSASKMTTHIGVSLALGEEQAIADEMIVDTSLALAPETMGLNRSPVPGLCFSITSLEAGSRSTSIRLPTELSTLSPRLVTKSRVPSFRSSVKIFAKCIDVLHQRHRFRRKGR